MKKNTIWLILLILMVYPAMLLFSDELPQYIQEAQKLYNQNKYIESMNLLEINNNTEGYKYYLMLLNEEAIADKTYLFRTSEYIDYVQKHLDRFCKSVEGSYRLCPGRIDELAEQVLKNSPDNKELISKMFYMRAEYIFHTYFDRNIKEHEYNEIIDAYKKAMEYAEYKSKEEIQKKIDRFERMNKPRVQREKLKDKKDK